MEKALGGKKMENKNLSIIIFFLISITAFLFTAFPAHAVVLEKQSNGADESLISPEQSGKAAPGLGMKQRDFVQLRKKYKDGELLVKFKPRAFSAATTSNVHKKQGSERIKEFSSLRLHHVKLKEGFSVEDAIKEYKKDPDVEYAEPNYRVTIQNTPNDTLFNSLWNMHNTGQTNLGGIRGTPGADIKATQAWDITTGSNDIVVAVIDSGIDYNHEDIAANMWVNPGEIPGNGIDDDGNGYVDDVYGIDTFNTDADPMDDNGHGSHIAGIIGAQGNNSIGVAGINWNIKLMACKFVGTGNYAFVSLAITCLDYVKSMKDRGVNIVATNNSWGETYAAQALYDAIKAQNDILCISAAGNDASNNDNVGHYPSGYDLPNIISVAATDSKDELTDFSNFGRRSVHVGAPGEHIVSLRANNTNSYGTLYPPGDPNAKYYYMSGTSMAAPHVTGLAALIKDQDPSRSAQQIKNLILAGGDPLPSLDGKSITGRRINAYGSLSCADKPVFSLLKYPSVLQPGVPTTLSVLSINCGFPSGPVMVTLSDGAQIELHDDGISPDLAAGDSIFSATWTPAGNTERIIFSSPAGSDEISLPPLSIERYLPGATTHLSYNQFLSVKGGRAPYSWQITEGSLPPGLTLDNSTGEISGRATITGTFEFIVQVEDTLGASLTRPLSIQVDDLYVGEFWGKIYSLTYDMDKFVADIAIDREGNAYVTGTVDGKCLTIKYDGAGNLIWNSIYPGSWGFSDDSGNYCTAIAVDESGSAYITGNTYGWDPVSGYYTHSDLYIKYDSTGKQIWESDLIGSNNEYGTDIVIDSTGNIYATGLLITKSNGQYQHSYFTAKLNPSNGSFLWFKTFELYELPFADASLSTARIAADGNGNLYITGNYKIIKYDPSGNIIPDGWPKEIAINPYDIVIDMNNNVLIEGAIGIYDFRLMKYDPSGNVIWTKQLDTGYAGQRMSIDKDGNIFLAGGDRTVKLDASGTALWTKSADATIVGCAVNENGDVYVAGNNYDGVNWDFLTMMYISLPQITTSSLKWGTVGSTYSETMVSNGGLKPVSWSITTGTLPPGLTLDGSTGDMTGVPTISGTYTFTVQVTDARNIADLKVLSIEVFSEYPKPDLGISDLRILTPAGAGKSITITDTTQNLGHGNAETSLTNFYLSENSVLDAGDIGLGNRQIPMLSESVISTGETIVTIPSGTAVGIYYIVAKADGENTVTETSEGNNTKYAMIKVGPDLVVSTLTVPSTGGAGKTITVIDTSANTSGGDAGPTNTKFYLSLNMGLSADDVYLESRAVGALAAGGNSPGSTTVTIPSGTATGVYFVIAKADADSAVPEIDEENNTKSTSTTIKIGPDLTVSSVTAPVSGGAGKTITVSDTTNNTGAGDAVATTTKYYLSTDWSYSADDVYLGSRTAGVLVAGGNSSGSVSVTIPADTSTGVYVIVAKADGDNILAETDETNNGKSAGSNIKIGPDLAISAVSAPASSGAGKTISVTDTTNNSGAGDAGSSNTSYYLSTTPLFNASAVLVGSRAMANLAAGANSSGSADVTIPSGTTAGLYYIIAKADGDSGVAEIDETNNTRASNTIKIGPDLVVSALTVPAISGAGKVISITDTTANTGTGDAGSTNTAYYLSPDIGLSADDVYLGSRAAGALAAGAGNPGSASVTIPSGTAMGTYYVIAKADGDNSVAESDESNNTRSGTIKIGPDLVVSALTVPTISGAGKPLSITDTITNSGGGDAGASSTSYYLSANTVFDGSDILLGSRAAGSLASGATSSGTSSVTIPSGTATGMYYIIARADEDNAVAETNENNNVRTSTVVKIGPDLVVTVLTAPATGGAGKTIAITDTTKNNGGGDASATSTSYYLSRDYGLSADDVYLGSRAVSSLAAGGSTPGSASVTIPSDTETGSYIIIAKADGDNADTELDETNNTKPSSFIKIGPDLAVSALTAPATGGAGRTISVTDTTKNNGGGDAGPTNTSFYLSNNMGLSADDVYLGSRAAAALAGGATNPATTSVTIPTDTATGLYYIIAKADADNAVMELDENNNTKSTSTVVKIGPDLKVTALAAPSTGSVGGTITITDTTTNSGGGDAGAANTSYYLSRDYGLSADDVYVGSRAVGALAGGASSPGSASVTIPAGTAAGSYIIIAKADGENAVAEADENNNTKTTSNFISIGP